MNSILDISVIWFCATWPMEGPNRLHLNYHATRRCCLHRDDKVRAIRFWCHVVQVRDPWRFLLPLLKVFVITPTVDLFTYVTSAVSEGVRYYADGGSLHVCYFCCFWRCSLLRRWWIVPSECYWCWFVLAVFGCMSYTIVPIFFSLLAVAMLCVLPVSAPVCDTKMAWYQLSDALFMIYQNWYSKICISCCLELIVPLLWIGTLYVADADKIIYLLICYK